MKFSALVTLACACGIASAGVLSSRLRPTIKPPERRGAMVELLDRVRPSQDCRAAYNHIPTPIREDSRSLTLDDDRAEAIRLQFANGPFRKANDFRHGSPGEVDRIKRSAAVFITGGEPDGPRTTHGSGARDAAFIDALYPSALALDRVGAYLLEQAQDGANDFPSLLCLRELSGGVRDAWFGEAAWLARYVLTYDYVRERLLDSDRARISAFIQRNAYFLAAQIDYGIASVFPNRLRDDYSKRLWVALTGELATKRLDTDGDCKITAADDPRQFPARAYDGGPQLTVLSQFFNNRRAASALAVGMAGAVLGDSLLVGRAKRYTKEWLAYGVGADGSEGEYLRNGEYCIAQQGLIYAASTAQSAALLADMLARRGDIELQDYAINGQSINNVIETRLGLIIGAIGWRYGGVPIGKMESQYNNSPRYTDNFHELGLLITAGRFSAQIRAVVLRDVPWPGSTGHAVATGYGSAVGAWTDVFNVYPSALLGQ